MHATFALTLSCIEMITQYCLKVYTTAYDPRYLVGGLVGYTLVALTLTASYIRGFELATIQLAWSIMSSALALLSGWLLFQEKIEKLVVPFIFLSLSKACFP